MVQLGPGQKCTFENQYKVRKWEANSIFVRDYVRRRRGTYGIDKNLALTLYLRCSVTYLAESLYKSHSYQRPDVEVGRNGHQEAEDGVDQHSDAQEIYAAVFLRQKAEGNLGDDVAVEKGTQYVALNVCFPDKGPVGAVIITAGIWCCVLKQEKEDTKFEWMIIVISDSDTFFSVSQNKAFNFPRVS